MTFREVLQKLGMWDSVQRKTYRELASMTDRELWDIGLSRGQITHLINEMANKENDDD
jgi:uncharacterized protein YjiS (DUF1127 family)